MKEDLRTDIENTVREKGVQEFPVYERYKGKQMHGSKTWQASEKEQKTVRSMAIIAIVVVFITFFCAVIPALPVYVKVILFVVSFLLMAVAGGYVALCVWRHHKEDPMEMHYYDVDYKHNYLTEKGYDNTREITKEEFFNRREEE